MPSLFDTSASMLGADIIAYAKVAPERGIDWVRDGLTYAVPEKLRGLQVGERVIVPLGKGDKEVEGYVVSLSERCDLPPSKLAKVKPIVSRDATAASLTPDLMELAQWMASYYCCPLGMVFSTMLPAAVKHGTGTVQRRMVGLGEKDEGKRGEGEGEREGRGDSPDARATGNADVEQSDNADNAEGADKAHGRQSVDSPRKTVKITKLQRAVLDAVEKQRAAGVPWTEMRELADLAGAKSISAVQQLIAKGLLTTQTQSAIRASQPLFGADGEAGKRESSSSGDSRAAGLILTPAQDLALQHLSERIGNGFSVTLLHGVTGSGKTEVYLRAIEKLAAQSGTQYSVPSTLGATDSAGTGPAPPSPPHPLTSSAPFAPSAIVLVPEIALTPQTSARFHRRFKNVAVLHSGLTAAQRHEQWRRIRHGEVDIVVGARSAVFAPFPAGVGIIIVDEEHEHSYKQDQLPRYHARDVAIKRAQLLGIPIILGSTTPSLESYWNATFSGHAEGLLGATERSQKPEVRNQESGAAKSGEVGKLGPATLPQPLPKKEGSQNSVTSHAPHLTPYTLHPTPSSPRPRYQLLRLPTRVPGLTLPKVEIVDLTGERRKRYQMTGKAGVHLLSLRLEHAIRKTLDAKAQLLLLLNRRGFANYIACPDHKCGWLMRCEFCDATMVYHKQGNIPSGGYVECHHCTARQQLPTHCPICQKKVTAFGLGVQRVEEELAKKFPGIRVQRMDSDSMRTARDYAETLEHFRAGFIDVLVGTQMIAKGLDFPNVRLVGVISADTALHMPDFRSSERTFQLIAQVAGRTGRGIEIGTVIVQTFSPTDQAIVFASQHDYDTFAAKEMDVRQQMGLPPSTRMARIVIRDKEHVKCYEMAKSLAANLTKFNDELKLGIRIRGPIACTLSRVAEYHRLQIELIAKDAPTLQQLLTALRNARLLKSDAHTAVDVDPVDLL